MLGGATPSRCSSCTGSLRDGDAADERDAGPVGSTRNDADAVVPPVAASSTRCACSTYSDHHLVSGDGPRRARLLAPSRSVRATSSLRYSCSAVDKTIGAVDHARAASGWRCGSVAERVDGERGDDRGQQRHRCDGAALLLRAPGPARRGPSPPPPTSSAARCRRARLSRARRRSRGRTTQVPASIVLQAVVVDAVFENAPSEIGDLLLRLVEIEVHESVPSSLSSRSRGRSRPAMPMMSRWISLVPPPKVSTQQLR